MRERRSSGLGAAVLAVSLRGEGTERERERDCVLGDEGREGMPMSCVFR